MIPNHNPGIRALFITEGNYPYTLPVVGWDPSGVMAYVPTEAGGLIRADKVDGFRKLERDAKGPNLTDRALSQAIEGTLEPVKVTTGETTGLEVPEDRRPAPTPSE